MKRLHVTWQLMAGWLTVALGAITAVTPVLPHEWDVAVPWLRPALGVAAVLIAAILRAPQSPTTATVAAQIDAARLFVPTTSAAEARRQHVVTLRGEAAVVDVVDVDVDQEAPTRPGGA